MPNRPSGHLRMLWSTLANTKSTMPKYTEMIPTAASTTTVDARVSLREGNVTLRSSDRTSRRACMAFSYAFFTITSSQLETSLAQLTVPPQKQARRDLNPHPPDLESGALTVRATGLYAFSQYILPTCPPVMLPRFSVRGVLSAKTTIFLEFKPIRGTTFIFCGCVVTAFALIARQDHHLPHSAFLSSRADIEQSASFVREYSLLGL